jgi:lysophospholipase L1-like esterase
MPTLSGASDDHVVIIGDSLSAGLDSRVPTWPDLFHQTTGATVKNLAKPGTTTAQGVTIAKEVTSQDHIVVLEIGGNDLFSNAPCNAFGRNLESIVDTVAAHGRTVVMFELPILPYQIACGRYQRQLASKYHVALIPKHYLTEIMASPNATSDGVHLTREGAGRFAAVVQQVLSPLLKPRAIS